MARVRRHAGERQAAGVMRRPSCRAIVKAANPTIAAAPTLCVGPLCAPASKSTSGSTANAPNSTASSQEGGWHLPGKVPGTFGAVWCAGD